MGVVGALMLYQDIMNKLLFLLSLMGGGDD